MAGIFRSKAMADGLTKPLVLIHKKTKQRYPLRGEDFVIGRSNGNLVFDHDPKLSGKHCLIRLTPQGFAIHDLKTRTGVHINGTQLPIGKACILRPGAEVSIGDQHFVVMEERPMKRPPPKRGLHPIFIALAVAILGGVWFLQSKSGGTKTGSQVSAPNLQPASIDAEFTESLARMNAFARAIRANQLTEEQTLSQIRNDLLPRFTSVYQQFQAYRPANGKEDPRLDFKRRFAGHHVGLLTAMANFIETKEVKYSLQMDQLQRQMDMMMAQQQDNRRPTSEPGGN